MSVQISPQIPFRPAQCPNCANYAESIQRCRAFVTESSPRPLLGIFSGESDEPCPRFEVHSQPEAFVQPPDPTLEQTVSTAQDLPGESDTVGLAQSDKSSEISADSQETSDKSQSTITDKIPPAVPVPVGLTQDTISSKARIHCQKCKSENPPGALRCQNCDANLLPSESIGQRMMSFVGLMVASAILGYLFYRFYILDPGSAPDFIFFNPGALGIGAFLCFIMAFVLLLRKTPAYVRYENRAKRHIDLNAWQALDDLNHAMDLAADKEQAGLIKQRAKVYEKLGLADDAARDHLTLATSSYAYKDEGEWVSLITGADADVTSSSMRKTQIATMLNSGKVKAVGYCKSCKNVVELNADQRCLVHPKVKGIEVEYVIPIDVLAGRLTVMQKLEHRYSHLSTQITNLLESGQAKAIGYCPRCKAAVQLDSKRRCSIHPKVKGRNVQYVVPGDEAAAKRIILRWRRVEGFANRRRLLAIFGLVLIVLVILNYLFEEQVAEIFSILK